MPFYLYLYLYQSFASTINRSISQRRFVVFHPTIELYVSYDTTADVVLKRKILFAIRLTRLGINRYTFCFASTVCTSLTPDGPQRAMLCCALAIQVTSPTYCKVVVIIPILSCLWSLSIFPSLPGSRLRVLIAIQVQHSDTSPTNGWILLTYVLKLSFPVPYGRNHTNSD